MQNIDMLQSEILTYVNILAFFSVVASSQISPHSRPSHDSLPFSGCKDNQKTVYTSDEGKLRVKIVPISTKCTIFVS